jgi:WD40 repeat protein
MNADPNARDKLLNDLSSTLSPASEPIADTPPAPPTIPDHELIRRIGRGSYGEVWLARNALGTWRAVKVVHRAAFDRDRPYEREFEGIRRFEPVSRTHPSQLNVLHVGRNDAAGHFYYVMELADAVEPRRVESAELRVEKEASPADKPSTLDFQSSTYSPRTLRSELYHRGRLPFDGCLRIGLALATALDHLHRHGLVHRDIKPSNIIFVNGIPKLADIGLVARAEATLSLVGTEGYLPPEGPGTAQADIYSLGKVLYEMATGRDRQEFPELPTNLLAQPAAERAQLAELNEIIVRACHTDLKQRYQTAAELHAEIALLQSGKSVSRMRTTERRLKSVARAGALVTALAVIAGLAFFYQQVQTREARRLAGENARLGEENRQRIVRLDVANGVRLLDASDPSAALLWFADALPLVTNNPSVAEIHRIRIQQTLDQTPRLLDVVAQRNTNKFDNITASAFSPDGERFATVTAGAGLTLRDTKSGQVLWELVEHGFVVGPIRFGRDGQRLFVCTSTLQGSGAVTPYPPAFQFAEVLDAASGRLLFPRLAANLECSAFSPDDRWLAVALTNHIIQLLDTHNGQVAVELKGDSNAITMLAFSDDGSLLAAGSRGGSCRIWRLPSGEPASSSLMHDQPVRRVVLSADGRYLATATWESDDPKKSQVQVWDVRTAKRIGETITETGAVLALLFSPNGNVLFASGETPTTAAHFVQVWNIGSDLTLQRTLSFPAVRCWDFSPDGHMLALGTDNGFVSIWSAETWELQFPPFRHTGWVTSVHFGPEGKQLLTTSDDATAKLWSLKHDTETARLSLTENNFVAPAHAARPRGRTPGLIPVRLTDGWLHLVDPDRLMEVHTLKPQQTNAPVAGWAAGSTGRHWALSQMDGSPDQITLWELQGGDFRSRQLVHPQPVLLFQFNDDDSRLVTFAKDGVVRFWRTSDGSIERSVSIPKALGIPGDLGEPFDHDCRTLLLQGGETWMNQYFQLFDLATGQLVGKPFPLKKIYPSINQMRLSPDGEHLASVGEDQEGTIIDLQAGELAVPQFKHGGSLHDLDWSPDGKQLLTATYGVKVWDAATGKMFGAPLEGEGQMSARWSADGRFIATRGDDNRARVYDASTTEPVTPFLPHSSYIRWLCITPGSRLITASDPNLLRAWDLRPNLLAPDILTDYAKFLSGRRLNAGGVLLPIPAKELAELCRSLRARAPQLFE